MANLNEGHRERLKNRFLQEGLGSFDDHTVFELLLFYAVPRRDTNKIAHELVNRFGSLANVLEAGIEDLCKVKGIGENSATLIKLMVPMMQRYLEDKNAPQLVLDTSAKAGEFLKSKYIGRTEEVVFILCLDSRKALISCNQINEGSVNATELSIRKIIEAVITHNATTVIISHNHPRGHALPSSGDVSTTMKIYDTLKAMNIVLLDHIIVAGDLDYVSMSDSGYFNR